MPIGAILVPSLRVRPKIFLPTNTNNPATNNTPSHGTTIATTDVTNDPPNSIVANSGFPKPPVLAVENPLATTVVPCTRPAVPPPAMIASVHSINGLIPDTIEAVMIVPAITAAGVEIVSSKWSTHGM